MRPRQVRKLFRSVFGAYVDVKPGEKLGDAIGNLHPLASFQELIESLRPKQGSGIADIFKKLGVPTDFLKAEYEQLPELEFGQTCFLVIQNKQEISAKIIAVKVINSNDELAYVSFRNGENLWVHRDEVFTDLHNAQHHAVPAWV